MHSYCSKNVSSGNYTLTFQSGSGNQTNVTGALSLTGNATNNLKLRSSSAAQWYLNATGSTTLTDLDVEYSNAVTALTANSSVTGPSGNNTGWTLNP